MTQVLNHSISTHFVLYPIDIRSLPPCDSILVVVYDGACFKSIYHPRFYSWFNVLLVQSSRKRPLFLFVTPVLWLRITTQFVFWYLQSRNLFMKTRLSRAFCSLLWKVLALGLYQSRLHVLFGSIIKIPSQSPNLVGRGPFLLLITLVKASDLKTQSFHSL